MSAKKVTAGRATAKVDKGKTATTPKAKKKSTATKVVKPERTDVFVSYSHADKKWLMEMQTHLIPLGREHGVNIWDDTRIQSGDKWRTEINRALAKSKVAILLVSARFMASDFISKNELPPLLQAAEEEGLIILSVIIGRTGAFTTHPISTYQAVNEPSRPLNLLSEGQVDEVFSQLYSRIHNLFVKPSKVITRTTTKANKAVAVVTNPKRSATSQGETTTKKNKPKREATSGRSTNALLVKPSGEWLIVSVINSTISDTINLDLRLTTSAQRSFLLSLRQGDKLSSIVFRSQTYVCKLQDVLTKTSGAQETWHVSATVQPMNRRADVTYGVMTPEKQAEQNARILLLNESLATDQSAFNYSSNRSAINSGQSPLPALYYQLAKQATLFRQAAPLVITWFLQTNHLVEHIHKLTLNLKGDKLAVKFEGQWISQYQNERSALIKVEGICDLTKAVTDEPVILLSR